MITLTITFILVITLSFVSSEKASVLLDFQVNDINTLNYALTLENLEYNFYRTGLDKFKQRDFESAGYNSSVYSYFGLIRDHEMSHVKTLRSAISARGGKPVVECRYNFAYNNSVPAFVQIAHILENTGVSAYDGAINSITELGLITAAASIATVEARHAAFLNKLVGQAPSQDAFDTPLPPAEVIATVSASFIVSCESKDKSNSSLPLPKPATFLSNNATNQTAAEMNDIKVLRYALFLESLEDRFYTYGLNLFKTAEFTAQGYNQSVYDNFEMISNMEAAHVSFLNNTLKSLGDYGLPYCSYNFSSVRNISDFIKLAAELQSTGTSAFVGATNAISNLVIRTAAATIATVEGRFSSYTNELVGKLPFPNDFEPASTPKRVYDMVSRFIQQCPYNTSEILPVAANFSLAAQLSESATIKKSRSLMSDCKLGEMMCVNSEEFKTCTFNEEKELAWGPSQECPEGTSCSKEGDLEIICGHDKY